MSELSERKQLILQSVVVEYVAGAEPVGSELLTQKYDLGVRSATVRNELAELSELGYLAQPHTSAGRVPSDQGYRYFVDHIVLFQDPTSEDKSLVHSVTKEKLVLHTMLQNTAAMLSRMTRLMTAATTLSHPALTVRSVLLSALSSERALIVVVLSNGHVENRLVEVPAGVTLGDVGIANEKLGAATANESLAAISRLKPEPTGSHALDRLIATVSAALRGISHDLSKGKVLIEGEEYLFGQPEFQRETEPVQSLLNELHSSEGPVSSMLAAAAPKPAATIGSENPIEALRNFTMIRHTFTVHGDPAGTIALIGPTRMKYDAAIPMLQYTAEALSQTLDQILP